MSRKLKIFLGLAIATFLGILAVVSADEVREFVTILFSGLNKTTEVFIQILWISGIAILFAAFLAPMEALGWWAGWYGDRIHANLPTGTLEEPHIKPTEVNHYVVYLDGISQSTYEYLPDVEEFLARIAVATPDSIQIIKGLMPYSVLNQPLTQDPIWSFFWRFAERMKTSQYGGIISALFAATINIRNLLIVMVSADRRYGPIYNQGIAQILYNSLIYHGYQPNSGIPITLIGYSGGGQISMGVAPFLKQALRAPIEVISLAGVISGNMNALVVEQLYHLVGKHDFVEPLGALFFPRRWKIFFLSYWARAKRRGNISFISLGPVAHQGSKGPLDDDHFLPDGRTYLQQTIDIVVGILTNHLPSFIPQPQMKLSNYERFLQADFNHPSYYPIGLVPSQGYHAIAPWTGRLILPEMNQRISGGGVLFEVHQAPENYQDLVGKIINLKWVYEPFVQDRLKAVTQDIHFGSAIEYSLQIGTIHPTRLNRWRKVGPLESLAGSRPEDDVIVALKDKVQVEVIGEEISLLIEIEPLQITGRFYGLVQILSPIPETDCFQVIHYNLETKRFDGFTEQVRFPEVISNQDHIFPSTTHDLEKSPVNAEGWYIYGALDETGVFVVQAIAPRALFRLQPHQVFLGESNALNYIKEHTWDFVETPKGHLQSVLLSPTSATPNDALNQWQEGDRALLLHLYGGIGGNKTEPAAQGPFYFGHFAYGLAKVIREPLTQELEFRIEYRQVYTHNTDGIIAGALSWERYMGDRQWGWLGSRPVCDLLIKLDAFTAPYHIYGEKRSPLGSLMRQLEAMTARYRIGDGTGGTFVGPANNCAQDSNQALYATIKLIQNFVNSQPNLLETWLRDYPEQSANFQQLLKLEKNLRQQLLLFEAARPDWQNQEYALGLTIEDRPLKNLLLGIGSWRSMFPRIANDTIAKLFIEQGASVWVLQTHQVGGVDPDIEAIAPLSF